MCLFKKNLEFIVPINIIPHYLLNYYYSRWVEIIRNKANSVRLDQTSLLELSLATLLARVVAVAVGRR